LQKSRRGCPWRLFSYYIFEIYSHPLTAFAKAHEGTKETRIHKIKTADSPYIKVATIATTPNHIHNHLELLLSLAFHDFLCALRELCESQFFAVQAFAVLTGSRTSNSAATPASPAPKVKAAAGPAQVQIAPKIRLAGKAPTPMARLYQPKAVPL